MKYRLFCIINFPKHLISALWYRIKNREEIRYRKKINKMHEEYINREGGWK
jgi:hypothetical protein